jgi:hypothetical protein
MTVSKQAVKPLRAPALPELKEKFRFFPFLTRKTAVILVGIIGFIFYAPSIQNEYALDDGIIIHQNDHVLKGIHGIKGILTKDAFESFYRRMCATDQLAGGRYRPLSVVSFALEQELIGSYRSGLYLQTRDLNHDNVLNPGQVNYTSDCGRLESNYEYNDYVDRNSDGQAQPEECYSCWDRNRNFTNEVEEDVDVNGIFNEMDCQVYGSQFRHFNNVWIYALGCMLLFQVFSRCFFRGSQDLAFLAALLFTMHPIHSEAIANVKSRDELFSLVFVSLTFLYTFRFLETKALKHLFWAAVLFFLALLSKEYAIMLVFLIPLAVYTFTEHDFDPRSFLNTAEFKKVLYTGLVFVFCAACMLYIKRDFDIHALPGAKAIRSFWLFPFLFLGIGIFVMGANKRNNFHKLLSWFYFVMLVYLAMRIGAVKLKPGVPDTEILNNPYLLANGQERFCSKVYVLLKYVTLLCFPHPLSSDYSYNSLEYRHFTSWDFILSLLLHAGLVIAAVRLTLKKHVLGFAMMVYIFFMLMIGNVLLDIGATMGERLVFHASIGFCIAVAYGLLKGIEMLQQLSLQWRQGFLAVTVLIIGVLFGIKAWERSLDWKNDVTLFLKDVKTMPHSVLALGNAGARWVDLADTKEITGVCLPGQDPARVNDYNGTLHITDEEVKAGNFKSKREAALYKGIGFLKHAIELHPRYVNGYLNLGLAHMKLDNDYEALYYWKNAERLYPNNPYLRGYFPVFSSRLKNKGALAFNRGRMDSAAMAYNKCTILMPNDAEAWFHLGGAYFNQGKYGKAKKCWDTALQLNPNYNEVKRVMPMITPRLLGLAPASTVVPRSRL